jgi:predicted dehydrogenase
MFGETAQKPWDVQLPRPKTEKPHRQVIRQFARAVLDDAPVPIPPEQSVQVVAMLEALYESSAQGAEVPIRSLTTTDLIRPITSVAPSSLR